MIKRLAHVGIAVNDAVKSSRLFSRLLGRRPARSEEVADQRVKTVFFDIGSQRIELLEPMSADSPVAKFIEKRGEGVHHLSFEVDDIEAEILRLKKEGFQLIDEKPRPGADGFIVAFLHPKSTNGVLIEICQKRVASKYGVMSRE